MIDKESLFWATQAIKAPGSESVSWYIIDWDRRRTVLVTFNGDLDSEDLGIEYLGKHIGSLGPDVHAIEISPDGDLVSVSSKPEDDNTTYLRYPLLRHLQRRNVQSRSMKKPTTRTPRIRRPRIRTVLRAELYELDRFSPSVDLVSYRGQKVVFKYCFWAQQLERVWDELNIWSRLLSHPNIVPFHRVVVERLREEEQIVGFTTRYIAGGTLEASRSRVFKLKWLKQLIRVVDDLNYTFGIQHQDIALRNLLVNGATDMIMLFDFNIAARVSAPIDGLSSDDRLNDVKGVVFTLYEIITRDDQFRNETLYGADIRTVLDIEWVKHPDVRLDRPVASYRAVLDEWMLQRTESTNDTIPNTSKFISWPHIPKPTERPGGQSSRHKADEDDESA